MLSARVQLILDTLRAVRGAKDLSKAVDDLADNMTEADKAGTKAAAAIDEAGDEMSEAARAAAKLDRQVEDLTGSLRKLAVAQALGGDDFSKQIRQQETQLRRLTRSRKLIGDPDDAAKGFAARFIARLGPLMASMPIGGPAGIAAAAAGAAAAPFFISAFASALSAGLGAGVIGAGVVIAARDPEIKEGGKAAGRNFMGALEREAIGAIKGPVLGALNQLDAAGQRTATRLGVAFRKLAPEIEPFTGQLIASAEILTGSLITSAEKSGPALRGLGNSMVLLSDATGDFITTVADGGPEAAMNLQLVVGSLGDVLRFSGLVLKAANEMSSNAWLTGPLIPLLRKHYADTAKEAANLAAAQRKQLVATEDFIATEQDVTDAQKAATDAQKAYKESIDNLAPSLTRAGKLSDELRRASKVMFGAQIEGVEANEAYQSSWDNLSASVKANKRSLDIHTSAGRANRDALQDLLSKNNELYFANIAAGQSIESARKKHENRTRAIEKEARKLGLNKTETQKLITVYGRIPARKETDLIVDGFTGVERVLADLYAYQRSLASGVSLKVARRQIAADLRGGYAGDASAFKRAKGGPIYGPGTTTSDSIPALLSNNEHVWTAAEVAAVGGHGAMKRMRAAAMAGELPGFAMGGPALSNRWPRDMLYRVDVSNSRIPTRAQVAAEVIPAFGAWPSSPGAQRGDSGVWRSVLALIRSTGPMSGSFGNAYRAGDPLWHGSGRAVDWMGFNQDGLARFLASKRPLELIHRTNSRDYAYTRGRNVGSFNNALMEAHRNHIHIAMANGGTIYEPVFGYGMRSGNSYSFAERGPERVTPVGRGDGVTIGPFHFIIQGTDRSAREIAAEVDRRVGATAELLSRAAGA